MTSTDGCAGYYGNAMFRTKPKASAYRRSLNRLAHVVEPKQAWLHPCISQRSRHLVGMLRDLWNHLVGLHWRLEASGSFPRQTLFMAQPSPSKPEPRRKKENQTAYDFLHKSRPRAKNMQEQSRVENTKRIRKHVCIRSYPRKVHSPAPTPKNS